MSTSIASLFEVGSSAYTQAHYNEALDYFSRAIKSAPVGHNDRLKLLDHRIGTLLKLKKFDEAFLDAKSIVREARTDGRGYLRCGQLETLKGNHHAASKWYAHGIKNVPPSARLHETLTAKLGKSRDIIQAELVRTNARDPLSVLPLEIVAVIIQLLAYRTVVTSLRVSRAWKNVLKSIPPLCDTIDFSSVSKGVGYPQFRAVLQRLRQYPRRAIIKNLKHSASKLLPEHLQRWFAKDCLEHLELYDEVCIFKLPPEGATKLRSITFGEYSEISLAKVSSILMCCTQLKNAIFRNVCGTIIESFPPTLPSEFVQPVLEHLELHYSGMGSFTEVSDKMFVPFRNLQILLCSRIRVCSPELSELDLSKHPLQYLELHHCRIDTLPVLPSTLLELNFSHSRLGVASLNNNVFVSKATPVHLPQLRTLNLYGMQTDGAHNSISVHYDVLLSGRLYPCLQSLHLDPHWSAFSPPEQVLQYFHYPTVKHLRFQAQELRDDNIADFMRKLPDLETLRLEKARITGVFVAALLRRETSKLKYLCLEECTDVSRDAVDFARNLGVTVEVKNKSESDLLGGRRIS